MPRLYRRAKRTVAASPGTLEYTGDRKAERVRIRVMDYDDEHVEEKDLPSVEAIFPYRDSPRVSWINVDGLHDIDLLARIGAHFGLHPLVLEDILHTTQRPKLEQYDSYIYLVVRMLFYDEAARQLQSEQLSLILGPALVLTFQEREGDVFDPVRERIRKGGGRARKMGADYLAYALIDAVVDNYFVVLEKLGEDIEELEEDLVEAPSPEILNAIHYLKREMILLRRSVWPLREVIGSLQRDESPLIRTGTSVFLRDAYDHIVQVADVVDSFRDMLSGLQDLYLSSISNRMNEVMKVLTIIATIFVPLTFVAGIYGMNFEYMPELKWRWGYAGFWMVILAVGIVMLAYFRRKRWL